MGMLTNLGLRRPGPPPCAAKGRFQIGGVTVVNPMRDRRTNATIEVSGDDDCRRRRHAGTGLA